MKIFPLKSRGIIWINGFGGRSQWPRCVRHRSAAARLQSLWVRIPPGLWMSVCCECCVLSGRGLCDELITRTEESYRVWCVAVCDLETSWMRSPWPTGGCCPQYKERRWRTQRRYLNLGGRVYVCIVHNSKVQQHTVSRHISLLFYRARWAG